MDCIKTGYQGVKMCSICYEDSSNRTITISCGHLFHSKCLGRWWATQTKRDVDLNCPMCRFEPDYDEIQFILVRVMAFSWIRSTEMGLPIQWSKNFTPIEDLLWAEEFVM